MPAAIIDQISRTWITNDTILRGVASPKKHPTQTPAYQNKLVCYVLHGAPPGVPCSWVVAHVPTTTSGQSLLHPRPLPVLANIVG
ncbi:hypothetical protein PspLS_05433 [Pyricularia sp. CBS 133598]|nr:hypothetical protein PspLS_05433 [Pyricularia sp. CBS 133598]